VLFRDGALCVAQAADPIGIRGIVVHAIAKTFCQAFGCGPPPADPMTLMVTLGLIFAA
jgi:hypothetical protein